MSVKHPNSTDARRGLLERRVEPIDLLSAQFDSLEADAVKQRLLIFAQPRTASFTLCRYFAAAGWGLPNEYLSDLFMPQLFERYLGFAPVAGTSQEDIAKYSDQLEKRRSRDGVFSMKVMWSQMGRFRMSYGSGARQLSLASHVYLRKGDFESQIVSFAMQQNTRVYSFSARHLAEERNTVDFREEDMVRRSGEYLIKEEARWFEFFEIFGLRPAILDSDDVTLNPIELMEQLSQLFSLGYDKQGVLRCAQLERDGRYQNQRAEKEELLEKHLPLLRQLAEKRSSQFVGLKAGFDLSRR